MKPTNYLMMALTLCMSGCAGSSVSHVSCPAVPVSSAAVQSERSTDAAHYVNINSTVLNENDVLVSWEPVENAESYIVDFGRASYQTTETSHDLSLDNHDWPNDMVGSETIEIHVSAVLSDDTVSDPVVARIEVPGTSLHFVFQDQNGIVVKEEDCAYTLPASIQTMDFSKDSVSIGPLELAEAPDGWQIKAESDTSSYNLKSGENAITLTVIKVD